MFGLDALALIGLVILSGSIAFALLDSAVVWLACLGSAATVAAVAGRNLVVRKLRPLPIVTGRDRSQRHQSHEAVMGKPKPRRN